ncbi:MAG: hypothetical protein NTW52_15370 [Planctomycetota bacterium]|nr:hypothetical protein [Planctomycetota bacterium]
MQSVRPQSPKQIERASSAIALSMVIAFGVMPKLNLTALAILAFLSLANQFTRKVAIVGFVSFLLSGLLNPVMKSIGFSSFAFPTVQYLLNTLEQFPVLPWFRLNSPAVLGSIWTGVAAYTTLMLAGLVMLSARSRECHATKANSMDLAMLDRDLVTGELELSTMQTAPIPSQMADELVSHVTIYSQATDSSITSNVRVENQRQRISSSAQFNPESIKENAVALAASEDYSNMEIRESIIEIIRFRSPKDSDLRNEASRALETSRNTDPSKVISLPIYSLMHTKTQSNSIIFTEAKPTVDAGRDVASSMTKAEQSMENTMNLIKSEFESTTPVDAMNSSNLIRHESHSTQQEPTSNLSSKPRDEALRYLLWHLSEAKDQPVIRERAS